MIQVIDVQPLIPPGLRFYESPNPSWCIPNDPMERGAYAPR